MALKRNAYRRLSTVENMMAFDTHLK